MSPWCCNTPSSKAALFILTCLLSISTIQGFATTRPAQVLVHPTSATAFSSTRRKRCLQLWNQIDEDNDHPTTSSSQDRDIGSSNTNTNNDTDNDSRVPSASDAIPAIAVFLGVISFWSLVTFLRINPLDFGNPVDYFDVDMYMALQDIMDPQKEGYTAGEIVELPSLSPAEQLVGSFFGPPSK